MLSLRPVTEPSCWTSDLRWTWEVKTINSTCLDCFSALFVFSYQDQNLLWSFPNLKDGQEFYAQFFLCLQNRFEKRNTRSWTTWRDCCNLASLRRQKAASERCGEENDCVEVGVEAGLSCCLVSEVITKLHMSMPFTERRRCITLQKCHRFSAPNRISGCSVGEQSQRSLLDFISQPELFASLTLASPCPCCNRKHNYLHIHLWCHLPFTKINLDGLRLPTFLHKEGRGGLGGRSC